MSVFYRIKKLDERSYRITSPEQVFMELLVGDDKAMLIDTGFGFGDLKAAVRSVTDKPLIIVNTHGHLDHACGNAQFDTPVYIGEEDMDLCKAHTSAQMRRNAALDAEHVMDWGKGAEIYGLPNGFDIENYVNQGSGELAPCSEGDVFDLGGVTVRVYETPGHTKGGRCFYYEQVKRLYTGDAANPFLWLFAPEATDRETHIKTLDKLIALCPDTVYCGHNPFAMDMEDLKRFKRAAIEADYEKGFDFNHPAANGTGARVYCLGNMTPADIGKREFAAIVISPDR